VQREDGVKFVDSLIVSRSFERRRHCTSAGTDKLQIISCGMVSPAKRNFTLIGGI
jgi:hypothetical protein